MPFSLQERLLGPDWVLEVRLKCLKQRFVGLEDRSATADLNGITIQGWIDGDGTHVRQT